MAEINWLMSDQEFEQSVGIPDRLLPEIAREVSRRATAWSRAYHMWRNTGQLTASIGWDTGTDALGYYADVGAIWYGRFLDPKARQLYFLRPLLPSSLEMINGRTYY